MLGKDGNGQDIGSMTDRERARRRAVLGQVEAYWLALCDGEQVPMRSQIDPRGMEGALENAFLLERISPLLAKFRVAGSQVSDLMGMQVAGMPFSTLIAPQDRETLGEAMRAVFADPAVLRLQLQAETGYGKPALSGSLLLLPLRSDLGDLSRALGCLVTDGQIGRTPRRFAIASVETAPAPGGATTARRRAEDAVKPRGFAEEQAGFEPASRRGHLRLVVSND